jgi:hypothetical protein
LRTSASAADAAYRADGGDGERWRIRAATVAGVRHRLDGRRCDDAFAWALLPASVLTGAVVVAVADGVSATPQAALAAEAAVAAACAGADGGVGGTGGGGVGGTGVGVGGGGESAPFALCAAALGAADLAVRKAVGDVTKGATTLVVVVVAPGGQWAASRIGDSDALILTGSGAWRPVFDEADPAVDEGVRSGATDALPGAMAVRHSAEGQLGDDEVLVLLTDGVAGPLRDGPTTVAVGLAEGLRVAPGALELALLIDFARQGCHDDRTVLALWPVSKETP